MTACSANTALEQPARAWRLLFSLELVALLPLSLYAAWVLPMWVLFFTPLAAAQAFSADWSAGGPFALGLFICLGGAFGLFAAWGAILSRLWGMRVGLSARAEFVGIAIGLAVVVTLVVGPFRPFSRDQWWLFVGPVVVAVHYFALGVFECMHRRHAS